MTQLKSAPLADFSMLGPRTGPIQVFTESPVESSHLMSNVLIPELLSLVHQRRGFLLYCQLHRLFQPGQDLPSTSASPLDGGCFFPKSVPQQHKVQVHAKPSPVSLCLKMHRSRSAKRVPTTASRKSLVEMDELPTLDPQSHIAKKEALRARLAKNAVHIIPVVLVLCAVVLWFFSKPPTESRT
ncbi:uncharacterized protein LOC103708786 isoform X1 [Phoenix dactylifera]|uniref:Uncharacterized protein LOC103708786 isoform X1 n=1 Tax=Phoenix dactylifera TaxID=42345 RepID=A0A8B8J5V0_PHODC|nr:uncharacterized protein LOC103708786 isoform X1 [Phoenix dactylifera]